MVQPHAPADGKPVSLNLAHPRNPTAVIQVVSDALGADGGIDLRHTAYGDNLSPPLRWTPVEGARDYALILEDPDAPSPKPFVHWLIWNIPAEMTGLPEGVAAEAHPPALSGVVQGHNGKGEVGFSMVISSWAGFAWMIAASAGDVRLPPAPSGGRRSEADDARDVQAAFQDHLHRHVQHDQQPDPAGVHCHRMFAERDHDFRNQLAR